MQQKSAMRRPLDKSLGRSGVERSGRGNTTTQRTIWLPVRPILGVARDGCALASGVMVCGYYGVGGVTQRSFASSIGVPFPPLGGIRLDGVVRGLLAHGLRARLEQRVKAATIFETIVSGHLLVGGHLVDRDKRLGHAVVLAGLIEGGTREPQVIVLDPNLAYPVLVGIEQMVASAFGMIVSGGRT